MAKRNGEKSSPKAAVISPEKKTTIRQAAPELPKRSSAGRQKEVSVNFTVTVPEGTSKYKRSVYLTGTLHKLDPHLPDWDPRGQEMKKVDKSHWTLTLTGPADTPIEYKYTLGSWDHVEKDSQCGERGNRRVNLTRNAEMQQVKDVVQAWRDTGCNS